MVNSERHKQGVSFDKLDIELMHHWTLSTCETFGDGPVMRSFWRENIVQLGLRCDFVMRGILAVAALHLAYLDQSRKPALVHRSVHHHDIASEQVSEAMHTMDKERNPEMEEDLFVFSVLTLYYSKHSTNLLSLSLSPQRDPFLLTPIAVMASVENFTGAFVLAPQHREQQSPDWMVFLDGAARFALTPSIRNNHRSLLAPLMREVDDLFSHRQNLRPGTYLEHLRSRIDRLGLEPSSPRMRTYGKAIHELDQIIGTSLETPAANNSMYIFIWLYMVSEDLIPLIRADNPPQEAIVILNYACMIPSRCPSRWWFEDCFGRLKLRAFELLDEQHKTWLVEPAFYPRE